MIKTSKKPIRALLAAGAIVAGTTGVLVATAPVASAHNCGFAHFTHPHFNVDGHWAHPHEMRYERHYWTGSPGTHYNIFTVSAGGHHANDRYFDCGTGNAGH
jgi:hypothetical protein